MRARAGMMTKIGRPALAFISPVPTAVETGRDEPGLFAALSRLCMGQRTVRIGANPSATENLRGSTGADGPADAAP